jgi:hypothetical protein
MRALKTPSAETAEPSAFPLPRLMHDVDRWHVEGMHVGRHRRGRRVAPLAKEAKLPARRTRLPFWNEISRPATSILFVVLPICGLIRRLDAHHMRPTQALELQRLALGRIKVRSLTGFDGDRHAGGRRTVHLVAVDYFG